MHLFSTTLVLLALGACAGREEGDALSPPLSETADMVLEEGLATTEVGLLTQGVFLGQVTGIEESLHSHRVALSEMDVRVRGEACQENACDEVDVPLPQEGLVRP